jgi:hypothetical protein
MASFRESLLVMKLGALSSTGHKENEQGMASFLITKTQEVPDAAICRDDNPGSLLGGTRCILGATHA